MAKEYDIFRIILDGPREHRADGSGTRETNPLYRGEYTIEDYQADKKRTMEDLQELGGTARVSQYWSFQCDMTTSLRANLNEWERYDKARTEALGRYDGPKEWPHGWSVGLIAQKHNLTIGRYYLEFYELTDSDLADAMDGLIGEYAKIAAEMSAYQGMLIEALKGSDEWRGILNEINEAYRKIGWPDMANDAEELAETMTWRIHGIPWDWDFDRREDIGDPLTFILNYLRDELEHVIPVATAATALFNLGEEYGALREFIEKELICPDPIIEMKLIRKLDYGDRPPEAITPEIREHIIAVYREMMETRQDNKTPALEGQSDGFIECPPEIEREFLQNINLAKISDTASFPLNAYARTFGKRIGYQTTFDEFIKEISDEINVEVRASKNRNTNEWLKSNLIVPGDLKRPTFGEVIFIEQIGAEFERAKNNGEELSYTENQLIWMRHGMASGKGISNKTRAEFKKRLRELSNVRVLIPEKPFGYHMTVEGEKDQEKELLTVIGKEERLIEPEIRLCWNDTKKKKVTTVYTFTTKPPTRYINKWFGENSEINRDLLLTESIPADELSPKAKMYYDRDGLRRGDRNNDALYLDPVAYSDLKMCVLYVLADAFHFKQKGSTCLILNLEEAYKLIYPDKKPPAKSSITWKAYVKVVYTYLTFLIEKGCVEGYDKGTDKGKDSGTVFVYLQEGNTMLYPPKQEAAQGSKKKRTRAKSKK